MKYQQFNRDNLKVIRHDLQALLNGFADKHGLEINLKNITFQENSFRVPVEAKVKGAVTMEESFNQEILKMEMADNQLQFDGMNGEKLIDYKPKRSKFPYIYTKGGSTYKCNLSRAKVIFGTKLPAVLHSANLFGEQKVS